MRKKAKIKKKVKQTGYKNLLAINKSLRFKLKSKTIIKLNDIRFGINKIKIKIK